MKKLLPLLVSCVLLSYGLQAQKLKITVAHTTTNSLQYFVFNPPAMLEPLVVKYTIDAKFNRMANLAFKFDRLHKVNMYFDPGKDKSGGFDYSFYLSPGDDVAVDVNFSRKDEPIIVTGKGSENNQPMLLKFQTPNVQAFYEAKDTLPNRVITEITKWKPGNEKLLNEYIAKYQPSTGFIKYLKYNLAYTEAETYYSFKENNKFYIREAYKRNKAKWNGVQDSLLLALKTSLNTPATSPAKAISGDKANLANIAAKQVEILNNDEALIAESYTSFLRDYLLREKERLWNEADENPVEFYREWYKADTAAGKKLFMDDQQNLLKEKIINKKFTGRTAEYLYTVLLQEAQRESDPKNVVAIYNRFKAKYPKSSFIATYAPEIAAVTAREGQPLTDKMIFAANNGKYLNDFKDVLALTKGKTVLIDMWGTWCGPCREEINANSAKIKEHFKGKGLDYLYVANYDSHNEANWKKLIAYFHLEGTHILANDKLNQNIMKTVKGEGYPTYFIIKKDGSYELSKAGYPMDRAKLIKQLEAALAM